MIACKFAKHRADLMNIIGFLKTNDTLALHPFARVIVQIARGNDDGGFRANGFGSAYNLVPVNNGHPQIRNHYVKFVFCNEYRSINSRRRSHDVIPFERKHQCKVSKHIQVIVDDQKPHSIATGIQISPPYQKRAAHLSQMVRQRQLNETISLISSQTALSSMLYVRLSVSSSINTASFF